MAKSDLSSRTARARLIPGKDHQEALANGRYLVYRRPQSGGAGSWACKLRNPDTGSYKQNKIGEADDTIEADGRYILTYDQAKELAGGTLKTMKRRADLEAEGEVIPDGPYTVDQAWADYISYARGQGVQGHKIMQTTYDAHIQPEFGSIQVSRLTKAKITKWHQELATKGRRKTGKKREEPEYMEAPKTEEEIRKRRDSANRILTNLKACLNHALQEGKVTEPAPWRLVKPFANTGSARLKTLHPKEQKALVAACDEDLQPLVLAGLYTGARYGELILVQVFDFDAINESLHIRFGKGKSGTKDRWVRLGKEGTEWFKKHVEGKDKDALMFTRNDVTRRARAEQLQTDQWASYDQIWAMEQAVLRAKIDKVTFHELRHTYCSDLLNAGMSLMYLAEQLGHSDTRMVTRHYGHIAAAVMAKQMAKAPSHGLNNLDVVKKAKHKNS